MSPMYHPILMIEFKLHCHWQIELAAEKRSRAAEGRYVTVTGTGSDWSPSLPELGAIATVTVTVTSHCQ